MNWTMHLAEGHPALGAPTSLLRSSAFVIALINFVEIFAPLFRRALFGRFLRNIYELKHFISHTT